MMPTPVPLGLVDAAEPTGAPASAMVNLRSTSLVVIAVLASLFALHWASAVFVPLLLAAIVGGIGSIAYSLSNDAAAMIEALLSAAQKLRRGLASASTVSRCPSSTRANCRGLLQVPQQDRPRPGSRSTSGRLERTPVHDG